MNFTVSGRSKKEGEKMLYLSAFLVGILCGAGTVLFLRIWNVHRERKYGFSETLPEKLIEPFASDKNSQYTSIDESVDGSVAVNEFKN